MYVIFFNLDIILDLIIRIKLVTDFEIYLKNIVPLIRKF